MKSILITLIFCVVFYSFCSAQPCNISNNTIWATSSSICTGSSAQINGSTPAGSTVFSYSWLQSSVGAAGPYNLIPAQTGMGLNTGALSGNRWYKRVVSITCAPTVLDFDTSAALAITVNSNNTIALTSAAGTNSQTRCINTALTNITYATTTATGATVSGLPAGVSGNWASNVLTISGSPTASGSFDYIVTMTGGCTGGTNTATGTITVTPTNTAGTASSTPTLCINTTLTNITHATTGATGIGTATGLPAGVTAALASNVITISGTPTVAGTFSYSIPLTGGCGSVNATGTITVQTLPTVNVGNTTPAICQGATTIALGGSFGGSATGSTWTLQTPANGSISSPNNPNDATFTAASNTPASVTLVLTSSGGVCSPVTAIKTINVNPNPVIANLTNNPCSGSPFAITPPISGGNIIPNGTTYSWPVPSQLNGLSGATAQSGQSSITQTLTNPTNSNVSTTYTVTATASGCTGTFNAAITVKPKPNITTSQNQIICSGAAFAVNPTDGSGNIVPTGTTYTWPIPTVTGGVSGGSVQTTGLNNVSQTLVNPTNTNQTATYTITATANACTDTFPAVITIKPKPSITSLQDQTICSGDAFTITPINSGGNIVPANTSYAWNVSNNQNVTGQTNADSTNSISQQLESLVNTVQTVSYDIIPTANQCTGSPFDAVITVNPTPQISSIEIPVCSGSALVFTPANGINGIVPAGTNLEWSAAANSSVTGISQIGDAASISNTLTNLNYANNTVEYIIVPSTATCTGDTFSVSAIVLKRPNLVCSPDQTICDGQSVQIFAADQFGNQNLFFNWANSPDAESINFPFIFNPIVQPSANATYSVSVADPETQCISRDTVLVFVNSLATLQINTTSSNICAGESVTLSSGNTPADWFVGNTLVAAGQTELAQIPTQTTVYTATVSESDCPISIETTVTVNDTPNPEISGPAAACQNAYWQVYTVNSSDEHGYQWQITNGEVMSGQGMRNVTVHWFNGTEGELSVREVIWETGCDAITDFTVALNGIAPDMVAVTQLAAGSNVLVCEDSTFSIYNWGYESKSNPGALFLNVHTQYCNFDLLDPTNYYYFVEHGNDENCLTRSYFNAPPVVSSIDDELDPQLDKLICWPNPAQNSITIGNIKSPTASNRLNVYNALGALIEVENFPTSNEYLLDVSQLTPGLYFIEIVNNTSSKRISFVKL